MIYEIFRNPNSNRSEIQIISGNGNVYYFPQILTVEEANEILYALYGEHVDWTSTAERNFSTEEFKEFGYELSNYATQNPEKTLTEVINPAVLRTYAEEQYELALWYDIQDAKEG